MDTHATPTRTAIVTGGSRGFGAATTRVLAEGGWSVVIDGRDRDRLARTAAEIGPRVTAVPGDVTDPSHRQLLIRTAARTGGLDLLVNNASDLGPSPLPHLDDLSTPALEHVMRVNVAGPLALVTLALPHLTARRGAIIDVTSDAAVEGYPGWGAYGASKAALEQLDRVLVAELAERGADVRVWSLDPGDMRTDMHQAAFPDEDISDRPLPSAVAPVVAHLVSRRPPSGRVRAADVAAVAP